MWTLDSVKSVIFEFIVYFLVSCCCNLHCRQLICGDRDESSILPWFPQSRGHRRLKYSPLPPSLFGQFKHRSVGWLALIADVLIQGSHPLRKNHIESTCVPHVNVNHMCSHVSHMCCSNFTRLPTCGAKFSHVKHMWGLQTHVNIVCLTSDIHGLTCGHMWGSCGLVSLSITLTCRMNMWNWNNTQNPHVIFMRFFRKGETAKSNRRTTGKGVGAKCQKNLFLSVPD